MIDDSKGLTLQNKKKHMKLNNIINLLIQQGEQKKNADPQLLRDLCTELIWAERKKVQLLNSALQINILLEVLDQYNQAVLLENFTLVLGNCKINEKFIIYMLQKRIPNLVLCAYLKYNQNHQTDEEEIITCLASFLKAYSNHFTQLTYSFYTQNGYCLLLHVCCLFYNCPQQLARTTILNILMTLLRLPYCTYFIYEQKQPVFYLKQWSIKMCKRFRNELKEFDQKLSVSVKSVESEYIIEQINDHFIFWEQLSLIIPQFLCSHFRKEVILPLVLGSFITNGVPLFSLAFSLFCLLKLIKVIHNLDLLTDLGMILFTPMTISYSENSIRVAHLTDFNLKKIFHDQSVEPNDVYFNFQAANKSFFNVIRSKDDQFIELTCNLIARIIAQVKKNGQTSLLFIKELGFGMNGFTVTELSSILVSQLYSVHKIKSIKTICQLLLYIQPSRYIDNEIKNQLVFGFKKTAKECLQGIQNRQACIYMTQSFQYDIRAVNQMNITQFQVKSDVRLLFGDEETNERSFYDHIPDTVEGFSRYQLMKTMIIIKILFRALEELNEDENPVKRIANKFKEREAEFIKPGTIINLIPSNVNRYPCKVIEGKTKIKSLVFEDDEALIIGQIDKYSVKIFINMKIKHICPSIIYLQDKVCLSLAIKKYDYNLNNLVEHPPIVICGFEAGTQYLFSRKSKLVKQFVNKIRFIISKTVNNLPNISLI